MEPFPPGDLRTAVEGTPVDGGRAARRGRAQRFVRRATQVMVAGTAGLVGAASLYVANVLPGRSASGSGGSGGATADPPTAAAPTTVAPSPTTSRVGETVPTPVA